MLATHRFRRFLDLEAGRHEGGFFRRLVANPEGDDMDTGRQVELDQ